MVNTFIEQFVGDENLNDDEADVLRQVGVRTAEDVDSLVRSFPSIVDAGVRLSVVSNAAAQRTSSSYASLAATVTAHPIQVALGAKAPPGTPITPGTVIGSGPPPPFGPAPGAPSPIDLRISPWPVRDQGHRGTCVAFGTVACVEHRQAAIEGPSCDYSEQFLYWAIKDHSLDPHRTSDGTWLRFARDMLHIDGVCHEALCAYVPTPVAPVSGSRPSTAAHQDALAHIFAASAYQSKLSGAAASILTLLQKGRPVAVSLPVFSDPAVPNGPINWSTAVAWAYGRVFNPPPRSVVAGGHCVCVTGFVPDSAEPAGGYFIFRNSWGPQWANLAPSSGSTHSPEQGYGEISATYVDSYCWEFLQL